MGMGNIEDIEIEIQVEIEDYRELIEFLGKSGDFQSEKHQVDEYFSPAHKDFLGADPVKEWLRLRNANGTYTINYKNWHYNNEGKSYHADEYESKVENIDTLRKIFEALNMKMLVAVEKTRKTWMYKDYEIALDSVKGLGNFVEIEFKGKTKGEDPERIAKEMINFLKERGCGKIELNYKGYPYQLLFGKEKNPEIH